MQEYQFVSSIYSERPMPKANRIGLLGGTFNPIHNGHIRMAQIAFEEFLLGKVLFLPSGQPPHKQGDFIAPSYMRTEMIRLAIKDCPSFFISNTEIERQGTTYTVDTLEYLTNNNPGSEYYFIIGADTLFELHTWKNIERVLELTKFICVLRPGTDFNNVSCYANLMETKYPGCVMLAEKKGPCVSSTHVRELASVNQSLEGFVPREVAKYINENRIYSCEE